MTAHSMSGRIGRPLNVNDIADLVGGVEVLHRRIHELRSRGLDYAAYAIEREMADLGLQTFVPASVPSVGDSAGRAAG